MLQRGLILDIPGLGSNNNTGAPGPSPSKDGGLCDKVASELYRTLNTAPRGVDLADTCVARSVGVSALSLSQPVKCRSISSAKHL